MRRLSIVALLTVVALSTGAPVAAGVPGLPGLPGATAVPAATPHATADESVTPQAQNTYTFYVAAESDDVVEKISFGPGGLRLVKSIQVGSWPTEIEGPHGLAVSPDGSTWYLSLAHGQPGPFGSVVKYATEDDAWLGEVEVGMFPATMAISPSIGLLYVANFNLHGLPNPSSISVIDPESMSEVGRVDVGVMPHGARMNREGTRLYSVNMMDDVLVEIDAYRMEITRRLGLTLQATHQLDGTHERHTAERAAAEGEMGGAGGMGEMEMGGMEMMDKVKPTWATAPTANGKIYVAANGGAKIMEIDVDKWVVEREFETPAGPYNLDVSADGKLLAVTYKSSKSVGFWDLESGEEAGRIATLRPIPHGIVISPDGRYAFATIEGIGGEPGSVEAYDLTTFERVANLDIGKQAGGIAFWKMQ